MPHSETLEIFLREMQFHGKRQTMQKTFKRSHHFILNVPQNALMKIHQYLSEEEEEEEKDEALLLLSTLWTMWKSCSTVVLCALLRLEDRRRSSTRAAGSQRLVRTQSRTSAALPGSMLEIHWGGTAGDAEGDAAQLSAVHSPVRSFREETGAGMGVIKFCFLIIFPLKEMCSINSLIH